MNKKSNIKPSEITLPSVEQVMSLACSLIEGHLATCADLISKADSGPWRYDVRHALAGVSQTVARLQSEPRPGRLEFQQAWCQAISVLRLAAGSIPERGGLVFESLSEAAGIMRAMDHAMEYLDPTIDLD
ncbi:hypothetical protein [Ideonella oryzae]|uniref:Uncharacterized protein n=1 Tax=Ideonella oryzae TaxID=2937441 RepID=A0ABT1BMI4_9BURK|nr:hypothetical protein [Ideonella oryzae]MCO5976796.1 hypothetical protein [Ideonella oryzae]